MVTYDPDSGDTGGGDYDGDLDVLVGQSLEPNVLIIFDNSGTMNNVMRLDQYDRTIDYTTSLLPLGKAVVFVRDSANCDPVKHRLKYDTGSGKPSLEYTNYTNPGDICSGDKYGDYSG